MELNATQWKSPGGAQVGWVFEFWPSPILFETTRFAFTSSTGISPPLPAIQSCAVRSPWPPFAPREKAIQAPLGENIGNRFVIPAVGPTMTWGCPHVLPLQGMTARFAFL